MNTQSIAITKFSITFYLYPISTLKSIFQVGCKWIKIAYTNLIKKCFVIIHLFSIPPQ